MEERSDSSSLGKLSALQYQGEPGVPCLAWCNQAKRLLQQHMQQVQASQRDLSPSTMLNVLLTTLVSESPAAYVLKHLKAEAVCRMQEAVKKGQFCHWRPPGGEERTLVLQHRCNVPEHETNLDERLREEFGALCDQAAARGWLFDPASAASSSSSSSSPDADSTDHVKVTIQATGAPSSATAVALGAVALNSLLDKQGDEFTPGQYVVMRTLLLFEIAFGASTSQQENEYRTLQQGTDTPDMFAAKLSRLRQTLRHNKAITDKHLALRFLAGLTDRACADSISNTLHNLSDS
jgi:hypothetical protein